MSDTVQRIFQLMEQRHVSAYRVSGWKTGKSNPKQDALEQLADYFGVSVDYPLGRSSEAGSSRAGRHGNSLGPLTVEENKALGQYLAFLRSRYGNEKAQAES